MDVYTDEIVEYIKNNIELQYSRHARLSLYTTPIISNSNRDSIFHELKMEITDRSISWRNSESIQMIE